MVYLGRGLRQVKFVVEIVLHHSLGNSILVRLVVVEPHRARNASRERLARYVEFGISHASTEDYLQNGHHPSDNVVRSDVGWGYHRLDSVSGYRCAKGSAGR